MHFHSQNLDTRPGDGFEASGHKWKRGRAWLHVGKTDWLTLHWDWNLWSSFCGMGIRCGMDDGLTFFLGLPPVSFWFSVKLKWLWKFYCKYDWHSLGFKIHDWAIWVDLWGDSSSWSRNVSFWHKERREFHWYPLDTIFGRHEHNEEKVKPAENITVAMPEGTYEGTAVAMVETWKRKRWPWWPSAKRIHRYHIDMKDPIPFPGKGESSWNCGEDACHGLICRANHLYEAVAEITESVLRSRYRYGNKNWRPAEKKAS